MSKGEFTFPISVGLANAIRRTIITDIESWAADSVTFKKNSSCQTDEYIAHRIGLIPFVKIGNGDTMELNVNGRTACASDMKGSNFRVVKDTEIIEMIENQEIIATIFFKKKKGSVHARYKMCSGVGLQMLQNDMYKLVFEPLNEEDPNDVLVNAISCLNEKIDRALEDVGKMTVS